MERLHCDLHVINGPLLYLEDARYVRGGLHDHEACGSRTASPLSWVLRIRVCHMDSFHLSEPDEMSLQARLGRDTQLGDLPYHEDTGRVLQLQHVEQALHRRFAVRP